MISPEQLRHRPQQILAIGSHAGILQSILDFDLLAGREAPSLVGVVTSGRRSEKLFWGQREILLPCFPTVAAAQTGVGDPTALALLNLTSGRKTLESTIAFFDAFPEAWGGHLFAEDVPELHALELFRRFGTTKLLVGPSGVGLLVPAALKLGAIGGTDPRQLVASKLFTPGNIAVLSASGGMTNELIRLVAQAGKRVSLGLTFGGDRFPATTPEVAFTLAEDDPATAAIVYYGELGGQDEYAIAELLRSGAVTKPVIAYIAGTIGESFTEPVQFGHAKALARSNDETASAKRAALEEAGATVPGSFTDFIAALGGLPTPPKADITPDLGPTEGRRHTLLSTSISHEGASGYELAGRSLTDWTDPRYGLVEMIVSALLGRPVRATETTELAYLIFKLTLDHGPQVAGALNTIVTARAGRDLVSSVAAGLLTIGPRFGGAVNEAARTWFTGVQEQKDPKTYVAELTGTGGKILGIGHKRYRVGLPDPRVALLLEKAKVLKKPRYLAFAQSIEAITTAKKGNLILNVDGTIAALLLDTLEQHEGLGVDELQTLIDAEFFNAFFVIPRTVGLTAHYLDQKRLDEGLLRLPDDLVLGIE